MAVICIEVVVVKERRGYESAKSSCVHEVDKRTKNTDLGNTTGVGIQGVQNIYHERIDIKILAEKNLKNHCKR